MSTFDSNHFLVSVVNSADDIELFLQHYNACQADDVLRSNVQYDERTLLVVGSEKRQLMCKKKLPVLFKAMKLPYKESDIAFVTLEDLGDFVHNALSSIRSGETLSLQEVEEEEQATEDVESEDNSSEDITSEVQGDTPVTQVAEDEKSVAVVHTKQDYNKNNSKCQYGVPILEVEYQTPNVVGLQESLFVNVADEDIQNFFDAVRSKVLRNIKG